VNDELLDERFRQVAQERIDDDWYRSLVVGIVNGGKSEVFAFGELDGGGKPDGDTVYEIGSITKTFTATLLADDVLSGRCRLDTPVVELLTGFKIPESNGKKITLGQLATHHSGLPFMPSNISSVDSANPHAEYDAEKMRAFLEDRQLSRDPGESFEYSNIAFGLLGHALAESAKTRYGALLDGRIFRPLGMTMSGPELTKKMRQHLAIGHDENGNPVEHFDLKALEGAGGICSTANDMLQYLKANMGVDQTPLIDAMRLAQRPITNTDKQASIGLAWFTTKTGVIWHNGGTGGYRSFLGFNADRNIGVVILSNSSVGFDDLGYVALREDTRLAPVYKKIPLSSVSFEE
jgi:serine-type D-Ala-D-Ala carboxypeptidase/endopeptidase